MVYVSKLMYGFVIKVKIDQNKFCPLKIYHTSGQWQSHMVSISTNKSAKVPSSFVKRGFAIVQ
jgi:hypothetical protein